MHTIERSKALASLSTLSSSAAALASIQANTLKASLANIDMQISADDAREVQTYPYGFDVHKAKREYMERKNFMDYLETVGKDGADALVWCREREIPVLAILPETVWSKVCVDAELFTLWPSQDGEVGVSTGEYDRYIREALSHARSKDSTWYGRRKTYQEHALERALHAKAAAQHFLLGQSKKSLLRALFPGYVSNSSSMRIRVRYPVPDETFGLALLRLKKARIPVGIVVEADAIDVSEFIGYALKQRDRDIERAREAVAAEEVRRRVAHALGRDDWCPILTFCHGKVRVIVAQYGNWPIEIKAVQAALEQDLRIKLD